ncbi:MAG: NUDIX domain-containing protein [Desulfovibrionales bacterium]
MPKQSAGLIACRVGEQGIELFLVHMGGPFWKNRDTRAWSIPKGEVAKGEAPLAAAKREFREETGFELPDGPFVELTPLRQPSGKVVHAWAFRGEYDPGGLQSNTFSLQWPPKSGKFQEFPEVDRGAWFTPQEAMVKLVRGQTGFVQEVLEKCELLLRLQA